jgi:lincosamide nucleotidyltransferase A/C/D/E
MAPGTLAPPRRPASARLRLALIAAARRSYIALERVGGVRRVLWLPPLQRIRRRWQHPMALGDALEILGALSSAGVRWWLAGGWGIDALLGGQTRRHKDLDLIVEDADVPVALQALREHGFRPVPESIPGAERHVEGSLMPHRELVQDAAARTVDLHPLDTRAWAEQIGIEQPFASGRLGGRQVGCLSATAQRAAHQGFELADEHKENLRRLSSC